MATEKQIAANRANAQRSTGPKTLVGKMKSGRNAFRHGLSCPTHPDPVKVDALAQMLLDGAATDLRLSVATELVTAQLELLAIRSVRAEILAAIDIKAGGTPGLFRLQALDRYERYAHTKRRRAAQKL
ncbi:MULTISPECIES: hypothetical protein [Bradyrhizobium]|uniref:Uncharacterized protein n=2 Tax=Bradyrhizobium TaxID=374 RepID=A0ABY0Q742_9BRAD|nr:MULTISPECIES: hypothetical protein [Bradyrhizobium]SDJ63342.1 hypothetical protein SAMN05444163_5987 [Bradyrhizobium ottawaense]SEC33484.1 hypothetical protein SAMN05444171_1172 [Bradyrhizobium lablabi]